MAALRPPGCLTSGLQHFAAGVVFAAAAIELLPGVLERSPLVAVAGFAAGIAVMFGFRAVGERLEHRREASGRTGLPIGLVVAVGVDFFIDGLILGAGFAAEQRVGVLLTVALAVEYLFVGLSLSASLAGSVSRRFVALAPVVLAAHRRRDRARAALLAPASPAVLAGVLAFGAVAFMYLATEELLVEAHARGETSIGSVGFFVGFLIYLVISSSWPDRSGVIGVGRPAPTTPGGRGRRGRARAACQVGQRSIARHAPGALQTTGPGGLGSWARSHHPHRRRSSREQRSHRDDHRDPRDHHPRDRHPPADLGDYAGRRRPAGTRSRVPARAATAARWSSTICTTRLSRASGPARAP